MTRLIEMTRNRMHRTVLMVLMPLAYAAPNRQRLSSVIRQLHRRISSTGAYKSMRRVQVSRRGFFMTPECGGRAELPGSALPCYSAHTEPAGKPNRQEGGAK